MIPWKKITRGLPRVRRYADDRAPTIEEIRKIIEYPDRRIKAIVLTMVSSGIRVGAWDHLKWGHIVPIKKNDKLVAAKMIVYAGDQPRDHPYLLGLDVGAQTRHGYSYLERDTRYNI